MLAPENRLQSGTGRAIPGIHLHSFLPSYASILVTPGQDQIPEHQGWLQYPARPAGGSVSHIVLEPATIFSGTHTLVIDLLYWEGKKPSLLCFPRSGGRAARDHCRRMNAVCFQGGGGHSPPEHRGTVAFSLSGKPGRGKSATGG